MLARKSPFEGKTKSFFWLRNQDIHNFEEMQQSVQDVFGEVCFPDRCFLNWSSNRKEGKILDSLVTSPKSNN